MKAIKKLLEQSDSSQLGKFIRTVPESSKVATVLATFKYRLIQLESMVDKDKCQFTSVPDWAAMYPRIEPNLKDDQCQTANVFRWSGLNSTNGFGNRR
jgi:hypothetical protein